MLLEKLNERVDALLKTINDQKVELNDLRLKVAALQSQNDEKSRQISQLYEDSAQRDNELQRIYDKINQVFTPNELEIE